MKVFPLLRSSGGRARALAAGLAVLVGPPSAPGGRVEATPDGPVLHLTVFNLPEPERTDPAARADRAVARAFEAAAGRLLSGRVDAYRADPERYGRHDWGKLSVRLHPPSLPFVQDEPQVLMALAGGIAPDVLFVGMRMLDDYVSQGLLYPLDLPGEGYLDSLDKEEAERRLPPLMRNVVTRPAPAGRRGVWALPYGGLLGRVVLYRRDLFAAAGLDPPHPEWNWDDFLEAARRLTDPARGRYGLYLSRDPRESWNWVNFLWSAGGEVLTPAPGQEGGWQPAFATEEGVKALDFYIRLCTEPWVDASGTRRQGYAWRDPLWPAASAKWDRGELGMLFAYAGSQVLQQARPERVGMAPMPLGPDGRRGAEVTSMMMGINAALEHPALRDAAWAYIRYYDSDEALRLRARVWIESGLARALHPDLLRRAGYEGLAGLTPSDWAESHRLALESGRPEPHESKCQAVYEYLTRPLREAEAVALSGRLPAEGEGRQRILRSLLEGGARRMDREMLGNTSPAAARAQRAAAALFLVLAPCLYLVFFRRAGRWLPRAGGGTGSGARWPAFFWMLFPALASVLFWQYLPLARGLAMAFLDYRLTGPSTWAGLRHFGQVLWSPAWWMAVWNTLRYAAWSVALGVLPPLLLALLLQEIPRGKTFFRILFYLPAVCGGLAVTLLWKSFYGPDEHGALNALVMRVPAAILLGAGGLTLFGAGSCAARLRAYGARWGAALALALGVAAFSAALSLAWPTLRQADLSWGARLWGGRPEPVRWLDDPRTAMLACVLPLAWAGAGPACLIYLAALKNIPRELFESAELDGAGFVDKTLFIVCPSLRVLLWLNVLGVVSAAFLYATPHVLAMTGGAAGTEVAGLHIFHAAFLRLQFGPATAMAWILASLLLGFTASQLRRFLRAGSQTPER